MAPRQTNRAFGLTFTALFAVIGIVAFVVFDVMAAWAMVLSALFLVLALAWPELLLPLNRLWGVLAGGLGHLNNRLLLGAFFYVFVTPIGLVMRAFGADPMHRRPDPGAASYFTPVGRQAGPGTYPDLF